MPRKEEQSPEHILEKYGVDVRIGDALVNYLHTVGDSTAVSGVKVQELPNTAPHFARMVIRYDLQDLGEEKKGFNTTWKSRGVMVEGIESEPDNRQISVSHTGGIESIVSNPAGIALRRLAGDVTRGVDLGWINLDQHGLFKIFDSRFDYYRDTQKRQFGIEIPELSLDDQIKFAMLFATHRPDYRFGINRETPLGPLGHIEPDSLFVAL